MTRISCSHAFERRVQIWQKIIKAPQGAPGKLNAPWSLPKTNLVPRVINTAEAQIAASAPQQVQQNNTGEPVILVKMGPESRGITSENHGRKKRKKVFILSPFRDPWNGESAILALRARIESCNSGSRPRPCRKVDLYEIDISLLGLPGGTAVRCRAGNHLLSALWTLEYGVSHYRLSLFLSGRFAGWIDPALLSESSDLHPRPLERADRVPVGFADCIDLDAHWRTLGLAGRSICATDSLGAFLMAWVVGGEVGLTIKSFTLSPPSGKNVQKLLLISKLGGVFICPGSRCHCLNLEFSNITLLYKRPG